MVFLGMKPVVREVVVGDGGDSPSFTLDLTDAGCAAKIDVLRRRFGDFASIKGDLDAGRRVEPGRVAETFREIVDAMLGEGAYDVVADYLTNGGEVAPEQANVAMSKLVVWLVGEMDSVIEAASEKAMRRYLSDAADAI